MGTHTELACAPLDVIRPSAHPGASTLPSTHILTYTHNAQHTTHDPLCTIPGEKLYIHCWGGRGRAGTVGACLLGQAWGLSADEALERVQRAFATRQDTKERSPETDQQREFVRQYIAAIRQ